MVNAVEAFVMKAGEFRQSVSVKCEWPGVGEKECTDRERKGWERWGPD